MSLCRRCEHRAQAYDTGSGPRYECTQYTGSVSTCYMYEPVKPAILKKVQGDKRGQFAGWMLSARSVFNGTPDNLKLKVINYGSKGKCLLWFKPTSVK